MIKKVNKTDDSYMVLKPIRYEKGWEKLGRQYTCKGLTTLLKCTNNTEFIMPNEIERDIEAYKQLCLYRKIDYFKNNIDHSLNIKSPNKGWGY